MFAHNTEPLAEPSTKQSGTGILPVNHGRDAHATRGFARASTCKKPQTAGFTLIEIALAALVIGLGILTLFGLARVSVQSAAQAEDEIRSALFAENVFAALRATSAELQRSPDTNAWPRFWRDFRNGETNLLDAAWTMWQSPETQSDRPPHQFPRIMGNGQLYTNDYVSAAPGRVGSTVTDIPEFRVPYQIGVRLTNAAPSLIDTPSRAEITLHVWSSRFPRTLEPFTFYTHFVNHGALP